MIRTMNIIVVLGVAGWLSASQVHAGTGLQPVQARSGASVTTPVLLADAPQVYKQDSSATGSSTTGQTGGRGGTGTKQQGTMNNDPMSVHRRGDMQSDTSMNKMGTSKKHHKKSSSKKSKRHHGMSDTTGTSGTGTMHRGEEMNEGQKGTMDHENSSGTMQDTTGRRGGFGDSTYRRGGINQQGGMYDSSNREGGIQDSPMRRGGDIDSVNREGGNTSDSTFRRGGTIDTSSSDTSLYHHGGTYRRGGIRDTSSSPYDENGHIKDNNGGLNNNGGINNGGMRDSSMRNSQPEEDKSNDSGHHGSSLLKQNRTNNAPLFAEASWRSDGQGQYSQDSSSSSIKRRGSMSHSSSEFKGSFKAMLVNADAKAKQDEAAVKVTVSGLKLTDPDMVNETPRSGEGHIHYQIDDGPIIATTSTKLSFHELKPGDHTINVTLVGNDHSALGPQESLKITIPESGSSGNK